MRISTLLLFFVILRAEISVSLPTKISEHDSHSEASWPAEPLNPSEFEASQLVDPGQSHRSSNFYEKEFRYLESFQEEQARQLSRNGLVDERKRWPKVGDYVQIPYIISSKFTSKHRELIAKAFENFHDTTCVRFVPRSTQNDYVHIVHGSGCDSDAGRIGGEQQLSLGPGCEYTDIAIHELNHAVGFWHEQNRPDRDNYVNVFLANVKPENRFNFDKMTQRQVNAYGVEYDTDSIMHYDKFAFSRDPQRLVVMEPRVRNDIMGLAKVLSKSDIVRIKKMYRCNGSSSRIKHRMLQVSKEIEETLGKAILKLQFQREHNEAEFCKLDFHHPDNCNDFHVNCTSFQKLTTCEENAWFKVTCRKTCNTCANPCQDMNDECPIWADNGACSDHFEYMNLYCPKSCEICQPDNVK